MKKVQVFFVSGLFAVLSVFFAVSAATGVENGGYANGQFLVTTDWLEQHVNDPDIRILDRQDIYPKDDFYSKGHIPNSIRMPTSAIKGMKGDIQEMLILKNLVKYLEENGVSPDDHIILVGRSEKLPATTRVFWALDVLGHKKMSILDGGIDKWKAEKRQVTTEVPHYPKVTYAIPALHRDRIMTGEELEGYLGLYDRLGLMVVDSRRPSEFEGKEMSRSSSKLGRIPGSTNLMFMALLTGKDYKEFKPAKEIQGIFTSKGLSPDKHLTFTCVSGCFGTVDYFAARLLDYPNVSVYDGAWIEWCKRNYPVEAAQGSKTPAAIQKPKIKEKKAKTGVPEEGC